MLFRSDEKDRAYSMWIPHVKAWRQHEQKIRERRNIERRANNRARDAKERAQSAARKVYDASLPDPVQFIEKHNLSLLKSATEYNSRAILARYRHDASGHLIAHSAAFVQSRVHAVVNV